jgi:hypothetical protein
MEKLTGRVYTRYDAHVFARCRLVAEQEAAKRPALEKERKPTRWHPAFAGFSNFQPLEFKAEEEEDIGV